MKRRLVITQHIGLSSTQSRTPAVISSAGKKCTARQFPTTMMSTSSAVARVFSTCFRTKAFFQWSTSSTRIGTLLSNDLSNNHHIDNFILEMQRSRDYFESQVGKGTIDRILLAPLQHHASTLSQVMHERLGTSVELIDPSVITEFTLASQGSEALLLASAAKAA